MIIKEQDRNNLSEVLRHAAFAASRLLYPPRCPLCDSVLPLRGKLCCASCEKKLPRIREPACMKCGKPVAQEEEYCPDCRKQRHVFDQGRAAFTYSGALPRSIYRMKAENRRDYLDFYADEMAKALRPYLARWQPEMIAAIPMHWRKRAARGYNQSELLALRVSRLTGIPFDRKLLMCLRYSGEQKSLGRKARMENLRGCFALRKPVWGTQSVLLVDDVYTTGSTLDEAARVLKAAGVRRVFFLVLCTGNGYASAYGTKSSV